MRNPGLSLTGTLSLVVAVAALGAAGGCTGTIDCSETTSASGCKRNVSGPGAAGPATPGAAGATPASDDPASTGCAPPSRRIMKLTPDQYEATLQQLLPNAGPLAERLRKKIAGASRFEGAAAQLDLTSAYVELLLQLSGELADEALLLPAVADCVAAGANVTCLRPFVEAFAAGALRRPLSSAEVDRYLALVQSEAALESPQRGVRQLFRAIFMAPEFLFRTELGSEQDTSGAPALTGYERASAVSYLLTDGPPDAELLAAAEANALGTQEQVAVQARRLLSEPGARGVLRFFREFLKTREVLSANKNPETFASFTTEVRADMVRETEEFLKQVLWQGDGSLTSLLTEQRSPISPGLAAFYGVPAPASAFEMTTFPGQVRAGLLTQGSLMATLAGNADSDIVHRGLFVTEMLLCSDIPSPPASAVAAFPKVDPDQPQSARLAQHRTNPACAACHGFIDPVGIAFENFDAVGRYRTQDHGVDINPAGQLASLTGGEPVVFSNVKELGEALASMPAVSTCLSSVAWEYAIGGAACVPDSIAQRPAPLDIRDLFAELASNAFLHRQR